MRKSTVRRIALAASALSSAWAVPALAQGADASADGSDIVVTARRTEEKLQDVPISITVFNQEQLTSRNVTNATELAQYTPSLSLNSRYGPEKSSFVIRGFSQELNTLPTVGVYFADVVAPRLSSNITSGNGAGAGDLFDLQNVQVLKGPQGTLFGRNTTGGAILLVPQKPKDKFEGYVEFSAGNYGMYRGQAVLNIPLTDDLKIRVGVDGMHRDGYLRNRSGIGPATSGDANYFAARLSILANLSSNVENYTIIKYSTTHSHYLVPKLQYCDPGSIVTATVKAECNAQLAREVGYGFYDVENAAPNPFVRSKNWQAINTTTWQASDNLTVKNIFSYGQSRESYSFSLSGDLSFDSRGGAKTFVLTNPGPNTGQGNQWSMSEELQFQGKTSDGRLTWQAGGYMEVSKPIGGIVGQEQWTLTSGACTDLYNYKCTSGTVITAQNTYQFKNYGIYAQGTYKLSDQFSVTGGIRYNWDWERTDASNAFVVPSINGPVAVGCRRVSPAIGAPLSVTVDGSCNRSTYASKKENPLSSSSPTWMIDLEYKPTTDILVFAKYSRGYRAGGLNEANVNFETWEPEKVDTYELGVKTEWRGTDVRGTLNVTGFWNEFKNQQASVFFPSCNVLPPPNNPPTCAATGINAIQNIGQSRMKGVEVDATLAVRDNLKFDFGYAYLDARVIKVGVTNGCDSTLYACANANFFATPGEGLAFAPKNRFTITGTYTLPLPESAGKVSVSATFTHTDSQFHVNGSRAAFAAGRIPFDAGVIPATDLLNLNLDWKGLAGTPIDLSVFATNVTDQKYWVASVNGVSSIGGDAVVLGVPRMFGFRVKYHFGN